MKTSIFLTMSFILVIFENSILNHFNIFGSSVDFLLVYICLISISVEKKTAVITAICAGFFRDMLVGNVIGLEALIFFIIAQVYSYIKDKIFKESRFTIAVLLIFASMVSCAFKMIFYREYINGNLYTTMLRNFAVFPIANSIFSVVLYRLWERLDNKFKKATSLY
ncbi:rod shape-determining protein MreD [Peptoclostridium litorale DSM 5388]|uniref:Uncharacterized protein n=1 Tax=Peptoclostridium litorale DSM 5388 TaxID=1121324 RepID=A0A069RIJ7_PEPLI|nr:rod shape-determining protein MreD [Peptoclostridium litorale]KDR94062.1 hypothetical protein CLIT_23c03340 [Peptoclostridium litorale DSM 5388]SIN80328.1 rod shape-determining protein MreD [Peptoclostridium litorale DSM 5388]